MVENKLYVEEQDDDSSTQEEDQDYCEACTKCEGDVCDCECHKLEDTGNLLDEDEDEDEDWDDEDDDEDDEDADDEDENDLKFIKNVRLRTPLVEMEAYPENDLNGKLPMSFATSIIF